MISREAKAKRWADAETEVVQQHGPWETEALSPFPSACTCPCGGR